METKTCRACGEEKLKTSFYASRAKCKECVNAAGRERYARDAVYAADRKQRALRYRERHPDRVAEQKARPHAVEAGRERARKWYEANRARVLRNQRAKLGLTEAQLDYCAVLDTLPCSYCGKSPANGVDHIHPKSKGGTHDPSNLASCCLHCNQAKGTKPVLEFLASRFMAATIG